jgi:glutathione S-transferase
MNDAITFYTNPRSRGRTVRWMLEEIGRPYRTEVLEFGPPMKASAYLAINPMGKVPALRHGETVITETAAICAYLADAFPEARLAPAPGDRLRGPYYRWLFFAAGPLEAAASNRALGLTVPSVREVSIGYGSYEAVMRVLEQTLAQRDYLVGDRFTTADLYLGAHLGFGMQFGTIDRRPVFERYWSRLQARPARQRADQLDDALIGA